MYYLLSERANCERRIVTENHPTVQMHIKEAIKLGVTPRTPEEIIKWMWGYEKKSDNVYDLIEEGDLIKHDGCIYEVSEITYKGYSDNRRSFISQPAGFKHQEWEITAIYKLNSKGDYIKVWEKE